MTVVLFVQNFWTDYHLLTVNSHVLGFFSDSSKPCRNERIKIPFPVPYIPHQSLYYYKNTKNLENYSKIRELGLNLMNRELN